MEELLAVLRMENNKKINTTEILLGVKDKSYSSFSKHFSWKNSGQRGEPSPPCATLTTTSLKDINSLHTLHTNFILYSPPCSSSRESESCIGVEGCIDSQLPYDTLDTPHDRQLYSLLSFPYDTKGKGVYKLCT